MKHVKREGATVLYVRHLGNIFFVNMADMAREFLRAFPNSPSCASGKESAFCVKKLNTPSLNPLSPSDAVRKQRKIILEDLFSSVL